MSNETKELMEKRKEAQGSAARTGSQEDLREARNFRNRVVDSRRRDRRKWEQEKLRSEGRSPAEVWKEVKGVLEWGACCTTPSPLPGLGRICPAHKARTAPPGGGPPSWVGR